MSYFDQIDKNKMPKHVAIIMDGNGRWAKQYNMERTKGHQEGLSAVKRTIEAAAELKLPYVTLYTFSLENWNRPQEEVDALMALMVRAISEETETLLRNNIRLMPIGNLERLPESTKQAFEKCVRDTSVSFGTTIILALSYSSKWEITNAASQIAKDLKAGKITEEDITEDIVASHLQTVNIPDPDLLIRTGGEKRISNFLLWQIAYAELHFSDKLWPEFDRESLCEAILDFQNRERRFGKTSEQISTEKNK